MLDSSRWQVRGQVVFQKMLTVCYTFSMVEKWLWLTSFDIYIYIYINEGVQDVMVTATGNERGDMTSNPERLYI